MIAANSRSTLHPLLKNRSAPAAPAAAPEAPVADVAVAVTDDGRPIWDALLMRRLLEYTQTFDIPVLQHAEDVSLAGGVMNEGVVATALGNDRYGADLPATGFSLDLVALTEALHLQHGARPADAHGVFLVNFATDRAPAVSLAHKLRDAGVRAARDCIRRPLEQSTDHAREQGFRWVADVVHHSGDEKEFVEGFGWVTQTRRELTAQRPQFAPATEIHKWVDDTYVAAAGVRGA